MRRRGRRRGADEGGGSDGSDVSRVRGPAASLFLLLLRVVLVFVLFLVTFVFVTAVGSCKESVRFFRGYEVTM